MYLGSLWFGIEGSFLFFTNSLLNLKKKTLTLNIDSAASTGGQGNLIHVLPLASAGDMAVDFNVLFIIYTLLIIRCSAKEITQHQALVSTIFNVY